MNKWTLASLRAKAEQIEFILPTSDAYQAICDFMHSCSTEQLQAIESAQIKWFSNMAVNFLASRA